MGEPTSGYGVQLADDDREVQAWLNEAYRLTRHQEKPQAHRHGWPPEPEIVPLPEQQTTEVRSDDVYADLTELLKRPISRGTPLPPPDEIVPPDPMAADPTKDRRIGHLLLHRAHIPH
jgi:hypothetical protein